MNKDNYFVVSYEPKIPEKNDYQTALAVQQNSVWEKLDQYVLSDAIVVFLSTLKPGTKKSYSSGLNVLGKYKFIDPKTSLQEFALVNHNDVIDSVKCFTQWSEASRQARCGCYIALTTFLNRRTNGLIKRCFPCKEGVNKTFRKIRAKVKTDALSRPQWESVLSIMSVASLRDTTIARLMLQGAKRIQEVLNLEFKDVDIENREITFRQSKSSVERRITITYPSYIFDDLIKLCPRKEGLVFTTRNGKKIYHKTIYLTFIRVGVQANLPFRLTPHCFRASAITYLKSNGYTTDQIMKISGHASSQMVEAYNKDSQRDNISKKVNLV